MFSSFYEKAVLRTSLDTREEKDRADWTARKKSLRVVPAIFRFQSCSVILLYSNNNPNEMFLEFFILDIDAFFYDLKYQSRELCCCYYSVKIIDKKKKLLSVWNSIMKEFYENGET